VRPDLFLENNYIKQRQIDDKFISIYCGIKYKHIARHKPPRPD